MDIEQEIKTAIRHAIMEEIDGLAIRATIRERIEAAGVTDEEIRKLIKQTADSYFRSAMSGNVEGQIRNMFETMVHKTVQRELDNVLGSFRGWNGRDSVKEALNNAVQEQINKGFDINVTVKQKE